MTISERGDSDKDKKSGAQRFSLIYSTLSDDENSIIIPTSIAGIQASWMD
jgi:hypothetical protein